MYRCFRCASRRSRLDLDIPADSGEAGVGANIGVISGVVGVCLNSPKVGCVPIAACLTRPYRWCTLPPAIVTSRTVTMPQFNDTELTAAVIRSFDETPDPRVKFLMEELVKSLHEFVRKTDLTFDEWSYAIDFLTKVGQKCTPTRQEFILLSDVFGVSMLVDAVNHRERDGATETTVLGPFYVGEHKAMPHGSDISPDLGGERMFVQSRVTDLAGKPLADVAVDG